jgi:mRNA interferase RelE/StbE
MRLVFTDHYIEDYCDLDEPTRKAVDKALLLLTTDPHYGSLRTKKLKGYRGLWEARVTQSYRLIFQIKKDAYEILRVGPHDILGKP